MDESVAKIDQDSCVNCELCKRTCPQNVVLAGKRAEICYAAWALDADIRKNSASGGIAAEIYRLILQEGWSQVGSDNVQKGGVAAGVTMTPNMEAFFSLSNNLADIAEFQNSKYIYSDMGFIYQQLEVKLSKGVDTLFVGLPCQIAGLRQYLSLRKISQDRLLTVDLVCHGHAPAEYLRQHIKRIEQRYRKKVNRMSFRDPVSGTETFTFALKEDNIPFYRKRVRRNDLYQVGYHGGIINYTNCYQCKYAFLERIADITLADFAGVGLLAPCQYDNCQVSCVLCNTEKGKAIIERLYQRGRIYLEKRPIAEALLFQPALNGHLGESKKRRKFVGYYQKTKDFERSIRKVVFKDIILNELYYFLRIDMIIRTMHRYIPLSVKKIFQNKNNEGNVK